MACLRPNFHFSHRNVRNIFASLPRNYKLNRKGPFDVFFQAMNVKNREVPQFLQDFRYVRNAMTCRFNGKVNILGAKGISKIMIQPINKHHPGTAEYAIGKKILGCKALQKFSHLARENPNISLNNHLDLTFVI
jgi:hypothetical protein